MKFFPCSKTTAIVATTAALILGSMSCHQVPRGFDWAEAKVVIPNYFLDTPFEPLEEWLDTPHRVYFHRAGLAEILDSEFLNAVNYEVIEYPDGDNEPVSIDSPGMTRRQLLWAVGRHYQMQMHIEYRGGQPSAIVLTRRHY